MKRFFFYLSLLLLPFFILLALEGSLRLAGFGKEYSLLKRQGDVFVLNPDYPAKFFSQNDIAIPEFIPQKIPVQKQAREKRLVCLGGSTTEGFPYEVDINFPHFLQCYLERIKPQTHWRVINLGLSAINSHAVRNMASDVLKLKPDAVLIYMGHNEFYGALGLASGSFWATNPTVVQILLDLKDLRTYQLLERFIGLFQRRSKSKPETLMAAMIKKSRILPKGPLYRKTVRNFKINLKTVISIFARRQIPVYVSTVTCNLKDQQPLGYPDPLTSIPHYKAIRSAMQNGRLSRAERLLKQAVRADALHPLAHFLLGEIYDRQGRFPAAKKQFIRAKDLDRIPFRAPSAINTVIREIADQTQARLVDTQALFYAHSPHGITDSTLFLEHLHPNAQGYQWLAFAFLKALLPEADTLQAPLKSCARFTDLDRAIGELKIADLVSHPPFNGRTHFRPHHFSPPLVQTLAYRHVFGHLFWDAAHLQLGDYFLQNKRREAAINEYVAVLQADSLHLSALYKIGDVLVSQKKFGQAVLYYRKAESAHPKAAFIKAKLARALLLSGNESQALDVINSVLENVQLRRQLSARQRSGMLQLKAIALTKLGRTAEAQRLMARPADGFAQ